MSSPEAVFEDLEGDRRSREGEIRLIERTFLNSASEDERSMLKRCLILVTYAHLEGFCKFACLTYISALNALNLPCSDASAAIAAASLSRVFAALRDPNSKHHAFRRNLADDTALHLSAREQVFVESCDQILSQCIDIPDRVVDTKSNLDTDILRKFLFQLGLNYSAVEEHRDNINKLLGIRNAIAHGDRLKVPTDEIARTYITTTVAVMAFLQNEIYAALNSQAYLKLAVPAVVPSAASESM